MEVDLDDLCCGSISQAAILLEKRAVSPVELTTAMLGRIEQLNPTLHAYVHVGADQAIDAAKVAQGQIQSGDYRGALHGVPLGIKDIFDTVTMPTANGSPQLVGRMAERNAHVVDRFDAAGAIMLGKQATAEFAFIGYHPDFPPPVNPWDAQRTPSVSSGGSAVAVAASLCFGTLGSDTGGSIRAPSAANGIVGLKPTFGRVSRRGVHPFSATLDHVGPMARSVVDTAILYQAVAGHDSEDPFSADAPVGNAMETLGGGVRGLRLGVDVRFYETYGQPEVVEATLAAVGRLRDAGMEVVSIDLQMLPEVCEHWLAVAGVEALQHHGRDTFERNAHLFGRNVRELLEVGMRVSADDLVKAAAARRRAITRLDTAFDQVDYLVLPGMSGSAPPLSVLPAEPDIDPGSIPAILAFSAPFNFTGHPTLSIPYGLDADDMPLGVQFVARPFDEAGLLKVGYAAERGGPSIERPRGLRR